MTAHIIACALGGFFAALAFAFLYNVQCRDALFYAALNGAVAGTVYEITLACGESTTIASFYAALAFSAVAEILARALKRPVLIFSAPALVVLVPGGDVYRMMSAFMRGQIFDGWAYGLRALAISGMIALAIILVGGLARLVVEQGRRLKKLRAEARQDKYRNKNGFLK